MTVMQTQNIAEVIAPTQISVQPFIALALISNALATVSFITRGLYPPWLLTLMAFSPCGLWLLWQLALIAISPLAISSH